MLKKAASRCTIENDDFMTIVGPSFMQLASSPEHYAAFGARSHIVLVAESCLAFRPASWKKEAVPFWHWGENEKPDLFTEEAQLQLAKYKQNAKKKMTPPDFESKREWSMRLLY